MVLKDSQKKAIIAWTILTVVLWAGYLAARLTVGGLCERPQLVKNFDSDQYLGRWYEIYRSPNPFESEDCATADYVRLPGNYIEVNNIEYSIDQQKNLEGIPDPGKAQCSSFRSGLCQVKFFELSPWSDYSILYTDYDTVSVVYGCDTFLGGALKLDWMWALTRDPLEIGSAGHTAITNTIFDVITSAIPDYTPKKTLRPTQQTTAAGCEYNSRIKPYKP